MARKDPKGGSPGKPKTFYDVLDEIRRKHSKMRDRGTEFERLTKMFLKEDSIYSDTFDKVMMWKEYPKNDGRDTGIDLVAVQKNGVEWAIQCKFYADDKDLDLKDIATFITKYPDMKKMLFFTGRRLTPDAWKRATDHNVRIIYSHEMAASAIDWSRYPDNISRKDPKKLMDHQKEALDSVITGFKTSDRGRMVMACGTGKTLTALHIAERIAPPPRGAAA